MMADLQVCYFCGSGPDSSLGEYAVVPPALEPSDDQQQSVVLCPDCREKLMIVMDPVVDAAESYAGAGSGPSGGTVEEGGSGGAGDGSASGEAADAADATADADAAGGAEVPLDSDDAPPATEADDGVTIDADESPADQSDADTVDPGDIMSRNEGDDDGPPADSEAPRDEPHTDDELVGRNNEAYNKTLRLLQNRDFPVERHEIEQVAANAYQLDPQEVSDAIEALINKGLLSQEGAQLVRS
jgi:hypothetical protein